MKFLILSTFNFIISVAEASERGFKTLGSHSHHQFVPEIETGAFEIIRNTDESFGSFHKL